MTTESLPDDMATTVWVQTHREELTKLVETTEDLRMAINTFIHENMDTALAFLVDIDDGETKPPMWLLQLMAVLSKETRELATTAIGLQIMGKAALAMNQPIEQELP